MKKLMYFLVLMLLLPKILAETQIFSGKVVTDSDKVIDGQVFRFTYDEKSSKAFVQTPATGLIVENGACKANAVFRVCINKANFSHKNITTYVYYYEIDTTIYKLTGSLDTKSKVSQSALLQNEAADFTITLTNPSDFDITDIVLEYDIKNFSIIEVKGCSLEGNKILWKGVLKSKYDKTCTAKIFADKEGSHNMAGNLSYFNGFEKEGKNTDAITITILPKQLKVTQLIDKDIEVKQPFYLNMSLQNIHSEEKLDVAITIEIPSKIRLIKDKPAFSKDAALKRSLTLEPSSLFNYSLYLEATAETDRPIAQRFEYIIKGIRDVIENKTFVNPLEPKPVVNFTSEFAELLPGQEFIVFARVKNPSRIYGLTNIKAVLNVPFDGGITQSLNRLMPNESYLIITKTLIAPQEWQTDTIKFDLGIEYSFNNIVKYLNKSLEVKLKRANATSITTSIKNETTLLQAKNDTGIGVTAKEEASIPEENFTATVKERLKSPFDKKALLFAVLIFAVISIITLIIYKIKKGKGGDVSAETKTFLSQMPKE